mmetsp:Transcript_23408/g.32805  ORF Transcript_23408/g.32805 Transcript_23408/m.32805 type:complete len:616 (-) Transcript_23408:28-1875(-)
MFLHDIMKRTLVQTLVIVALTLTTTNGFSSPSNLRVASCQSSSFVGMQQKSSSKSSHCGPSFLLKERTFRTNTIMQQKFETASDEEITKKNKDGSTAWETSSGDDLKSMAATTTTTSSLETINGGNNNNNNDNEENAALAWMKENVFLGIEPTPEIIAIMTIYFVEGALGLARLAQTFLLKDELHLGPAELSALTGIFTLPWTIKPLYGFLSDGVPLFGYRRRSYLVLAGILGCFSYAAVGADFWGVLNQGSAAGAVSAAEATTSILGVQISVLQATIGCLLLSSATIAFSDVVADGIVVQRTRDSNDPKVAGGFQSLCWGSAAIGGLLSAYFSGSLLETISPRDVFGLTAILPLIVSGIALLIDEEPVSRNDENDGGLATGVQDQISDLWSALRQPSIWRPALFIFLWQSTPTSDGAFLYFMTDDLGFGPEFLGRVRLVTGVAGLVGVWAYQKFLRNVPIKDILFWASIASTPLGLSTLLLITHVNRDLGIPDGAFVFGDDVALAILGEIAFLPTLVLAARLCPPGVEAVLFATLMSIFNGASTVGTEVGALLTKALGVTESNFDNLALLTVICNISSLYPLFFIGWLDEVGSQSEEELEQQAILDVAANPIDK